MSEFTTGIASTIARLVREDMDTHNVQNANVTTFKDMRELSDRGGEPVEAHLRYDPTGEAAGMVITLPDGRQLRVVVEEV